MTRITLTTFKIQKNGYFYWGLLWALSINSFAAEPPNDAKQLKSAISLRQSNQHQQAVDILEGLLKEHRDHKRINIELALNYIKLSDFKRSQKVLDRLKTLALTEKENTKLANLIKLIKSKQTKKASPHIFYADVSLFYGSDSYNSQNLIYEYFEFLDDGSNYSFNGSSEELLEERSEEGQQQKESYFAQQFKGVYRYNPLNKVSLFGHDAKLFFTNTGTLYQRKATQAGNKQLDIDKYQQFKLDSSLSLLTDDKWIFSVKYRGRYHYQGDKKILADHNLGLYGSLPLKYGRITLGIEHKEKHYSTELHAHNASMNTPSLEYSYRFTPALKLNLGTRYRIYQTVDKYGRYRSQNFYGGISHTYSDKVTTFISYSNRDLVYAVDAPDLVKRELKGSWTAGIKINFNKRMHFGLNLHRIKNTFDKDAGNNKWRRIEANINYRF